MTKMRPMNQNKLSSKVYPLIKSVAAGAVLPVLFIYIMIAKPDYKLMNALSHVVVPVAQVVGDVITWPVRVIGNTIDNVRELATLRDENEELRVRLDAALANKHACDIAIAENQKLVRKLDMVQNSPRKTVIANVIHDNSAMGHNTYIINRGSNRGIEPGQVVVSPDMVLVGIVIDAAPNFSRVRALTDSDTNIAVRVVGSEVYGFMRGDGSGVPVMGFFSDPEFQATGGIKLVTSNISGVLPDGLIVGEMKNETDVKIINPASLLRVMVLQFDTNNEYK
ncbi:MAG: rod shape-determining protein MreC [Alphaproteobacteria bacterium]|nr:rod shape-determining protein MreC [Alphaproteobacteria bacterium]